MSPAYAAVDPEPAIMDIRICSFILKGPGCDIIRSCRPHAGERDGTYIETARVAPYVERGIREKPLAPFPEGVGYKDDKKRRERRSALNARIS
jgi:hypothetical protein